METRTNDRIPLRRLDMPLTPAVADAPLVASRHVGKRISLCAIGFEMTANRTATLMFMLLLSSGICACSENQDGSPASATLDSAGVVIVSNVRPQWVAGDEWVIDAIPDLVLGNEGSEFQSVKAVFQLGNGTVAVLDANEINLFDPRGVRIATAGGEGDGPGEYRSISAGQLLPGDTLEVWDGLKRRVVYNESLQLVRDESIDQSIRKGAGFAATPRLTRGTSVIISSQAPTVEPTVNATFRGRRTHTRVSLQSWEVDTILEHDGGFVEVYLGGGESQVTSLSPQEHVAVSMAGDFLVTGGVPHEIQWFNSESRRTRIIRRATPPRSVTPAEADSVRSRRHASLTRSGRDAASVNRIMEVLPVPSTFPSITGLVLDTLGYIWAAEPIGPLDTKSEWAVYAPDGTWLGKVVAPGRQQLLVAGADYLIMLAKDELDQQYVRRYRLNRRAPNETPM
jgi:hypothetical protein